MYLTHMTALAVEAFEKALRDALHPVLGSQEVWVGPEFPAVEANYPGVWVTYEPGSEMVAAGVGHRERAEDIDGNTRQWTRWTFTGTITATVVALSRRQRDELMDEVVRLIAFADEHPHTSALRTTLEGNDLIAVSCRFGAFRMAVINSPSRTPWGTDEAVWEGSVAIDVEGEFVSDLLTERVLVPLSAVVVVEPTVDTTIPSSPRHADPAPGEWH